MIKVGYDRISPPESPAYDSVVLLGGLRGAQVMGNKLSRLDVRFGSKADVTL